MKPISIMEELIVNNINQEIGRDVNNLHRASTLVEHYKNRFDILRANLKDEGQPIPLKSFNIAHKSQQHVCDSIDFQVEKLQQFGEILRERIRIGNVALKGVQLEMVQVQNLQQLQLYLSVLHDIQQLGHHLSQSLERKEEHKLVKLYLKLYEEHDIEHSIFGKLCYVEAPFLKTFTTNIAKYWHNIIKDRFTKEFELILKSMKWGQREQDILHFKVSNDQIIKAQTLAEYLFLLKSPVKNTEPLTAITSNIVYQPLTTFTKCLLVPFKERFLYHFTGVKQTNRLDKPEWFYTQILNWARDTCPFVAKTFQASALKAGKLDFNVKLEYLRGLTQLAIEKVANDIDEICRDDNLFAHLLDETLAFDAELREQFGYPSNFPSAISVITQPAYLLKWIYLEQKFCSERMDMILQSGNAWQLIDSVVIDDDLKIPKCADQFIRLLESVKDRYHNLIQPGHQLQFLNLQLELIDNFRRRLVQLHSSGAIESVPILNAINYIKMVLIEWGENIHYLHLRAALMSPNTDEIVSTFEHPILELEHWSQQLIKDLSTKAASEIKAKSMPYRHDSWPNMPEQILQEPFVLSSSAGEMFQTTATLLHDLERELSSNLFNLTLRFIAEQIDDYLLDNMIMNTKFSPAAAAQFNYDITRNMFPLFRQYSRRSDLLFKKTHDANTLLNANRGTAVLLHKILKSDVDLEEKLKPLKEIGILNFKLHTCIEVLERRTDIKMF